MRLGLGLGLGFGLVSLVACGGSGDSQGSATTSSEAILGGTRHSEADVAQLLSQAGFADSDIPTMVCTAKYESNFWDGARNRNSNGSTDWGLFQINDRAGWPQKCGVSTSQLLDATTNTQCAKVVFDQQGITAWYGYQHHQSECDSYQVDGWSGSAQPGGGGAQCLNDGQTCINPSDCCSNDCSYGTCGGSGGGGSSGNGGGGACTGYMVACGDGTCGFADGDYCSDPSDCCSNDCTYGTCGSGGGGGPGGGQNGCARTGDPCSDGPDCCGYASGTGACMDDPSSPGLARCVGQN
jgi:lysozyme C